MGASGSGKTSIAKELEKDGYYIIHSYTTRKPREENEWGQIFIDDWEKDFHEGKLVGFEPVDGFQYIDVQEMIAYFEGYGVSYFATREQYRGKGTSIYVIDPTGAQEVHNTVEDADVMTIFLTVDRENRMCRMFEDNRCFDDIENRLDKDRLIFNTCKCDYVVDANGELDEVVETVKTIIEYGGM